MARIVSLHGCVVHEKAQVEQGLLEYHRNENYTAQNGVSIQKRNIAGLQITYRLKNGRELSRSYQIPVDAGMLADPVSPAALLLDICNNRDHLAADFFPDTVSSADFIDGSVSFYQPSQAERTARCS
jgi:hypothetical protein